MLSKSGVQLTGTVMLLCHPHYPFYSSSELSTLQVLNLFDSSCWALSSLALGLGVPSCLHVIDPACLAVTRMLNDICRV